jgi:hypothetical protein
MLQIKYLKRIIIQMSCSLAASLPDRGVTGGGLDPTDFSENSENSDFPSIVFR